MYRVAGVRDETLFPMKFTAQGFHVGHRHEVGMIVSEAVDVLATVKEHSLKHYGGGALSS